MMARPHCVVVVLLLLAVVSGLEEGASNPGFVARITRKGLEYARQYGVAILKKELSTIELPDFSGSFKISWIKIMSYEFYSSFDGTFDMKVDDICISAFLNLGKDQSGRLTASMAHCNNSIGHISIDISGKLSWILNLFHERIENKFKNILEQKICEMVGKATTSRLEPYLQTLPVISMIDQVASIDYSLIGAPQVNSQVLDTPFKGEFFGQNGHSRAPFDAPPIRLPEKHDYMVYFAISEYVFNTASWVYHQAGYMNFTIQNQHLARMYPNMELELEMSPESAPLLMFTPGNVTLMPVIDVQAFALKPNSSDRKPLFQLRVTTSISATINVSSDRIVGSVTPGSKLKLELKHSNINFIDVELMEVILNYYALHTIYPSLNAKLEEGFPLPLPVDTYLNSSELQVHENFLLLVANLDY